MIIKTTEELTKDEKIARAKKRIEQSLLGCKSMIEGTIRQIEIVVYENRMGLTPQEVMGAFEDPSELTAFKETAEELIGQLTEE